MGTWCHDDHVPFNCTVQCYCLETLDWPSYFQVWIIYHVVIGPSQMQIKIKEQLKLWCPSPYLIQNKITLSHRKIKSNQFISIFDWWLKWMHLLSSMIIWMLFFPYLKYHIFKSKSFSLYLLIPESNAWSACCRIWKYFLFPILEKYLCPCFC